MQFEINIKRVSVMCKISWSEAGENEEAITLNYFNVHALNFH